MTTPLNASLLQHLTGTAELTQLGVIRAEGDDVVKFLQGQLTQDVALLGLNEARLAAFCSAKGRMLASFMLFKRSPTELWLVCSRDILPPTLKRLGMFVMRAKVKLSDASDVLSVHGLAGTAVQTLLPADATSNKGDLGAASWVRLPAVGGVPRALWIAPASDPAPAAPDLPLPIWLWAEVHSGVAPITAPIVEAFVPQMLNYESVDGVNFKKGCYPGQEVVARSQFRGTLKRRGYIVHADASMAAGQEVFYAGDATQPCGTVAFAAPSPTGGSDAIASLQVVAANEGGLTLGTPDGPPLTLLPLPYPLRDDI